MRAKTDALELKITDEQQKLVDDFFKATGPCAMCLCAVGGEDHKFIISQPESFAAHRMGHIDYVRLCEGCGNTLDGIIKARRRSANRQGET